VNLDPENQKIHERAEAILAPILEAQGRRLPGSYSSDEYLIACEQAIKELAPRGREKSEEADLAERVEAGEIAALAADTNLKAQGRENCTPEEYLRGMEEQADSLGLRLS
jgi:hypothetical protein